MTASAETEATAVATPVFVTTNDDRAVGNAVDRDLPQESGRDHRITKTESAVAALEVLAWRKLRVDLVARSMATRYVPPIRGVQPLDEVRVRFPYAKKGRADRVLGPHNDSNAIAIAWECIETA